VFATLDALYRTGDSNPQKTQKGWLFKQNHPLVSIDSEQTDSYLAPGQLL
jgi:hypothetical protein